MMQFWNKLQKITATQEKNRRKNTDDEFEHRVDVDVPKEVEEAEAYRRAKVVWLC